MAKASVMLIKNSLKSSFQDKKLAGVKLSEASRLENVLTVKRKTRETFSFRHFTLINGLKRMTLKPDKRLANGN